jgi:methionine synthase II (cobalamin-independent)
MSTIKQILMKRDGMSEQDANELIEDAKEAFREYLADDDMESAMHICEEFFGLEPDYLMEIM